MDDPPYTTPEEDPFNVRPLFQNDLSQKRSSMFDKWIHEQQRYSSPCDPVTATIRGHSRSHSSPMNTAFLAYPELSRSSLDRTGTTEDAVSETGYDLVDDSDIPPDLAASFLNMEVTDAPATIRATKRISRMSLSPTSFRHFNLVFRSPSSNSPTEETPSRPPSSSKISLFSRSNRNSTGTITSRGGTLTPHGTPSKPSKRSSYAPPLAARTSSASKWRPSVLGHFTSPPPQPQSSPPPPYQDTTNYTLSPSRPSVSSCSGDTSNAATSLTVPSTEGSHGPCQSSSPSPTHSSPSGHGHRPHSRNGKHYSGSYAYSCSTDTMSGASSMRSRACSSSVNTSANIHDLFGPDNNNHNNSNRDFASPSPTLSAGTGRGNSNMGVGPPRMYPFVYNNGVQNNHRYHRRGGAGGATSTFDGIPSSYHYRPRGQYSAVNPDGEFGDDGDNDNDDDDDGDELDNLSPLPTSTRHRSETLKKKKPHVIYSSQHGTALSRMSSLSSIALSPVSRHRRKKKKLVISGIAVNDTRRFEGVKRWCESFGEVRQILRLPNGDLVISFQSAEVADTVCRVRAKVFINGVGSVQLSWTTEKHK